MCPSECLAVTLAVLTWPLLVWHSNNPEVLLVLIILLQSRAVSFTEEGASVPGLDLGLVWPGSGSPLLPYL